MIEKYYPNPEYKSLDRFCHFIAGLLGIFDGLISVLSFGFFISQFQINFIIKKSLRQIRKKQ